MTLRRRIERLEKALAQVSRPQSVKISQSSGRYPPSHGEGYEGEQRATPKTEVHGKLANRAMGLVRTVLKGRVRRAK